MHGGYLLEGKVGHGKPLREERKHLFAFVFQYRHPHSARVEHVAHCLAEVIVETRELLSTQGIWPEGIWIPKDHVKHHDAYCNGTEHIFSDIGIHVVINLVGLWWW